MILEKRKTTRPGSTGDLEKFQEKVNEQISNVNATSSNFQALEEPTLPQQSAESVSVDNLERAGVQYEVPESFFNADPTLNSLLASSEALVNQRTQQVQAAANQGSVYENQIKNIFAAMDTEGEYRQLLNDEYEIDDRTEEYNDLLGVINKRTASSRLQVVKDAQNLAQIENESRGVPTQVIAGKVASTRKVQELEKLVRETETANIVATAELMAGQIATAKETIEDKIKLQYGPLEDQLERVKYFLDRNDDKLSDLSTSQKEALKSYVENQQEIVKNKKEEERKKFDLQAEAAKNGASADTLRKIIGAETLSDAANIANDFIGEQSRIDINLDRSNKQSQIADRQARLSLAYAANARAAAKANSRAEGGSRFKFTNDEAGTLLGTGLSSADVDAIEADINEYGYEKVAAGLSASQQKALNEAVGGPGQEFLGKEYFRELYTDDQLKAAAKESGFTAGGFLGIGVGSKGVEDYLDYLDGSVAAYRKAGWSDEDILDAMRK